MSDQPVPLIGWVKIELTVPAEAIVVGGLRIDAKGSNCFGRVFLRRPQHGEALTISTRADQEAHRHSKTDGHVEAFDTLTLFRITSVTCSFSQSIGS